MSEDFRKKLLHAGVSFVERNMLPISMDDLIRSPVNHNTQRGGFLITRETTPEQRELFQYANLHRLSLDEAKPRLARDKKEEAFRKEREEREAPYNQRMQALEEAKTFEDLKPILADIIQHIWGT